MSSTVVKPAAVLGATAVLAAVQMWQTIRNRNDWPFCAYNMFNYRVPARWEQLRVALYDDAGNRTGPIDPWGLLPLEFFRVVSLLDVVFLRGRDAALQTEFCERTLHRLNTTRWRDFDEVRGSVRSPSGRPFAALELYLVDVDQKQCDPTDRASVLAARLVHRHDPRGVVRDPVRWAVAEGED